MPLYTNQARKDLKNLPEPMRAKVVAMIKRLDEDPTLGWKLKGKLDGMRSINVGRAHRVIYSVGGPGGAIIIKTIRARRDAYR